MSWINVLKSLSQSPAVKKIAVNHKDLQRLQQNLNKSMQQVPKQIQKITQQSQTVAKAISKPLESIRKDVVRFNKFLNSDKNKLFEMAEELLTNEQRQELEEEKNDIDFFENQLQQMELAGRRLGFKPKKLFKQAKKLANEYLDYRFKKPLQAVEKLSKDSWKTLEKFSKDSLQFVQKNPELLQAGLGLATGNPALVASGVSSYVGRHATEQNENGFDLQGVKLVEKRPNVNLNNLLERINSFKRAFLVQKNSSVVEESAKKNLYFYLLVILIGLLAWRGLRK